MQTYNTNTPTTATMYIDTHLHIKFCSLLFESSEVRMLQHFLNKEYRPTEGHSEMYIVLKKRF